MYVTPTHTASGLPWQLRHADTRLPLAMAQQHEVSELLASILAGRGVGLDEVPHFLNPTLRDYLPDPFSLRDMEKTVARLIRAIEGHEHIAVFGDYDVDGATSTTLLVNYFALAGIAITPYIPDRMSEGYGPSVTAFNTLIDNGAELIITVDCGTLAHAPIAFAQSQGVDVIVLDHHLSSGDLPNAHAVVNPNRVDENSPLTNLAAVGVTFLTLVALNAKLKERRLNESLPLQGGGKEGVKSVKIDENRRQETLTQPSPLQGEGRVLPNLLTMLDLVALGTVCDVMTLTGLNRAFVAQGLKVMAQRRNLGLSILADVARMDETPNVYHLGFLLGPRINAGGRVGKSGLGVELLTTDDAHEAARIAAMLDTHNLERQVIEAGVIEQAFALAESQANLPVILVAGAGWHQGVIGIVAGRLKEKYSRPAIVLALDAGIAKASARSVAGVDMGAAVHAAIAQGLITTGGGHAMAAGFTTDEAKLADLHAFLIARMEADVNAYTESRVVKFDGTLSVSGASLETLEDIARAGPFGMGNPAPRFVVPNARISHVAVMKEKHLRITLTDESGDGRLNAVAFGAVGTSLGEWLMGEKRLHLLGELKRNRWQGRDSAQFMIDDVAKVV
jgi:single-stranded-DNA-specific exonuclease